MLIEALSIQGLWPFLSRVPWLATIAMRWYFTQKRLASLVYVDLQPRHESAHVNLGSVASFQIYLQIINVAPIEIELDRASIEFWCAGVELKANILKKEIIKSGQVASVVVRGEIAENHANAISIYLALNRSHLTGNIEFNSRIRSFPKDLGHLAGVQVTAINLRAKSAA